MAKLVLKFEDRVLKECPLGPDVTIGRLPDNVLIIDNPAVSGHHARVFLDGDGYVVEDLRSRNGTYVNDKHVIRHTLQNGDVMLIGKHQLLFDEGVTEATEASIAAVPTLGATAYLDTKKHRALLTRLREERARERARKEAASSGVTTAATPRLGMLHVLGGNAEKSEYRLEDRTSFIGKSEAALVRLRGWFTPRAVAAIAQTDRGYAVTPMTKYVVINNTRVNQTRDLADGDVLEVHGLVLRFQFSDHPRPSQPVSEHPSAQENGEASVA